MSERVEDQLKEMIVDRLFLQISPDEIGDETDLVETHEVDSVQLLEIVMGLEEVFGVSFDDEEFSLEIFATVSSIADAVRAKLKGETDGED
ncbi:MAG: acyl carrier protein [Candidatus Aenigmarchaeota archaeon]|nr:acyl carrier protein [Candidatus Aenigmarchaeota archaeon]